MLITGLEKFAASFSNLTGLRVLLKTEDSFFECQFIQALLEILYTSSIYNRIRIFQIFAFNFQLTLENMCLVEDSYALFTEKIILRNNEVSVLIPFRRYSRIKRIPQCLIYIIDPNLKFCKTKTTLFYTGVPRVPIDSFIRWQKKHQLIFLL